MSKQSKKDRKKADARKLALLRRMLPYKKPFQKFLRTIECDECWEITPERTLKPISPWHKLEKEEMAQDDLTTKLFLSTPEGRKLAEELGFQLSYSWVLEAVDQAFPIKEVTFDETVKEITEFTLGIPPEDYKEYFASPGKKPTRID